MSGGCDRERSDEERTVDALRSEVRRLTDESAAGWALAKARLKIMEEQAATIARLRAEIARIPGLEQANREAHQAIAALKAKIKRINEARFTSDAAQKGAT